MNYFNYFPFPCNFLSIYFLISFAIHLFCFHFLPDILFFSVSLFLFCPFSSLSFLCNLFSFYYFFSYPILVVCFHGFIFNIFSFLGQFHFLYFSFPFSHVLFVPVLYFSFLNLTFLYFMSCPVLSLVLFSPVLYFPSWPYSSRTLIVLIAATSDHVSSKRLPQSTCVWMQCTVKKTSRTNTPPIWNAGLD